MHESQRSVSNHAPNPTVIVLSLLTIGALVIRLVTIAQTIDVSGDGPTRAVQAYTWSQQPQWLTSGIWPPAYLYLTGLVTRWFPYPLYSLRVLNAVLGAVSIPVFYQFVRRIYDSIEGRGIALLSAIGMTVLQLHISLSSSSLAESALLSWIIFASAAFLSGTHDRLEKPAEKLKYGWKLGLFFLCFGIAQMTRYEAWLFVPLFPLYYFARVRKLGEAIAIAMVCLFFPGLWMWGNHLGTGNALIGFSDANTVFAGEGKEPGNLGLALQLALEKPIAHLGAIPVMAAIGGFGMTVWSLIQRKMTLEQGLHFAMLGFFSMAMFRNLVIRGESFWDRYLLMGFVLALPWMFLPVKRWLTRLDWKMFTIALVLILSLALPRSPKATLYLTREQPAKMQAVAQWLQQSEYRDRAALITPMNWEGSYLPIYFPELGLRSLLVSFWVKEPNLKAFIQTQNPTLLITNDDDQQYIEMLKPWMGDRISQRQQIFRTQDTAIYQVPPSQ